MKKKVGCVLPSCTKRKKCLGLEKKDLEFFTKEVPSIVNRQVNKSNEPGKGWLVEAGKGHKTRTRTFNQLKQGIIRGPPGLGSDGLY